MTSLSLSGAVVHSFSSVLWLSVLSDIGGIYLVTNGFKVLMWKTVLWNLMFIFFWQFFLKTFLRTLLRFFKLFSIVQEYTVLPPFDLEQFSLYVCYLIVALRYSTLHGHKTCWHHSTLRVRRVLKTIQSSCLFVYFYVWYISW